MGTSPVFSISRIANEFEHGIMSVIAPIHPPSYISMAQCQKCYHGTISSGIMFTYLDVGTPLYNIHFFYEYLNHGELEIVYNLNYHHFHLSLFYKQKNQIIIDFDYQFKYFFFEPPQNI